VAEYVPFCVCIVRSGRLAGINRGRRSEGVEDGEGDGKVVTAV
jgi:hypothetical protein